MRLKSQVYSLLRVSICQEFEILQPTSAWLLSLPSSAEVLPPGRKGLLPFAREEGRLACQASLSWNTLLVTVVDPAQRGPEVARIGLHAVLREPIVSNCSIGRCPRQADRTYQDFVILRWRILSAWSLAAIWRTRNSDEHRSSRYRIAGSPPRGRKAPAVTGCDGRGSRLSGLDGTGEIALTARWRRHGPGSPTRPSAWGR